MVHVQQSILLPPIYLKLTPHYHSPMHMLILITDAIMHVLSEEDPSLFFLDQEDIPLLVSLAVNGFGVDQDKNLDLQLNALQILLELTSSHTIFDHSRVGSTCSALLDLVSAQDSTSTLRIRACTTLGNIVRNSNEARLYLIQLDAPKILCQMLFDETKLDSTQGLVEVHQIVRVLAALCGYVFAPMPKVYTSGFASFGIEGEVLERFLGLMVVCCNGLRDSVPKAHDHRLFLNILTEINLGLTLCCKPTQSLVSLYYRTTITHKALPLILDLAQTNEAGSEDLLKAMGFQGGLSEMRLACASDIKPALQLEEWYNMNESMRSVQLVLDFAVVKTGLEAYSLTPEDVWDSLDSEDSLLLEKRKSASSVESGFSLFKRQTSTDSSSAGGVFSHAKLLRQSSDSSSASTLQRQSSDATVGSQPVYSDLLKRGQNSLPWLKDTIDGFFTQEPLHPARLARKQSISMLNSDGKVTLNRHTLSNAVSEITSVGPTKWLEGLTNNKSNEDYDRLVKAVREQSPAAKFVESVISPDRGYSTGIDFLDDVLRLNDDMNKSAKEFFTVALEASAYCTTKSRRGVGMLGLEQVLPEKLQAVLRKQFPSALQRRFAVFPVNYFSDHDLMGFPSRPRVLEFPRRSYLTFPYSKMLPRLVQGVNADADALLEGAFVDLELQEGVQGVPIVGVCFKDSHLSGNMHAKFVDSLMHHSEITSVCFSHSGPPSGSLLKRLVDPPTSSSSTNAVHGEDIARLFGDLSARVNWCTFDNVLTASSVSMVAMVLRSRNHSGLEGVAITRHGFTANELEPIIRYLGSLYANSVLESPALPKKTSLHTLKYIDLTGNYLGDSGAVQVLQALTNSACAVEALDLSMCKISKGRNLVDALIGAPDEASTYKRDAEGQARLRGGLLATNKAFKALYLGKNSLSAGACARLLFALSHSGARSSSPVPAMAASPLLFEASLEILDLDDNALKGRVFEQAVVSAVAFSPRIKEFGFAGSNVLSNMVDICPAVEMSKSMQFMRFQVESKTKNAETRRYMQRIESALEQNRVEWMKMQEQFSKSKKAALVKEASDKVRKGLEWGVVEFWEIDMFWWQERRIKREYY